MRLIHSATASVIVLSCSAATVFAGAPTEHLKASIEQVIKVLEDPGLKSDADKRRESIRQVANNVFDFSEAGRRALGRHWQPLSENDRQEFAQLFADVLERAYVGRIEQYSGERIAFVGETVDQGSDLATVRTRFTARNGTEIPVDYRMLRRDGRWIAYDVAVEGLSMVANYRSQFNRIIESSSYQDLVKRLRERSGEFGAPSAAQPKRAEPPRS
jgi:phospholipid transport system substrate-binding protein